MGLWSLCQEPVSFPPTPFLQESVTFEAVVSKATTDSNIVLENSGFKKLRANYLGLWYDGGSKITSLKTVELELEASVSVIFRSNVAGEVIHIRFRDMKDCEEFVDFSTGATRSRLGNSHNSTRQGRKQGSRIPRRVRMTSSGRSRVTFS